MKKQIVGFIKPGSLMGAGRTTQSENKGREKNGTDIADDALNTS